MAVLNEGKEKKQKSNKICNFMGLHEIGSNDDGDTN